MLNPSFTSLGIMQPHYWGLPVLNHAIRNAGLCCSSNVLLWKHKHLYNISFFSSILFKSCVLHFILWFIYWHHWSHSATKHQNSFRLYPLATKISTLFMFFFFTYLYKCKYCMCFFVSFRLSLNVHCFLSAYVCNHLPRWLITLS